MTTVEWLVVGVLGFIAWAVARIADDSRASRKILERLLARDVDRQYGSNLDWNRAPD